MNAATLGLLERVDRKLEVVGNIERNYWNLASLTFLSSKTVMDNPEPLFM
jgi:hypothetical protein